MSLGNQQDGITIENASNTTIAGNLISGNSGAGINIQGTGATSNLIKDNRIGTNSSGTAILPNSLFGVYLGDGASKNIVGPGNLISGNGLATNQGVGVYLFGPGTTGNLIVGNLIGLDARGTVQLTTSAIGVLINQAPRNTVRRNVISGNRSIGLEITGQTARGNLVRGNKIGTNKAGTRAVGNGVDGVFIDNAPHNMVGGTKSAEANLISGNGSVGIQLFGPLTRGERGSRELYRPGCTAAEDAPHGVAGILVDTNPLANTIGGRLPGEANHGQVRVHYARRAKGMS